MYTVFWFNKQNEFETSQTTNMIFLRCFFFVGHFCPPGYGSTADQTESGSGIRNIVLSPSPTKKSLDAVVIGLLVISSFLSIFSFFSCASKRVELISALFLQAMYSYWCNSVLRIRDDNPRSRILIFTRPGSRIQKYQQKRGVKKNLLSYLFL